MRNILIHDYDDIDLEIVWNTIEDDVPPLIAAIEGWLANNPPPPS